MMMTFAFEGRPVRFVGTADRPEWVAQDVCDVLAIQNARDATVDFANDEKGVATVYTPGGQQEVVTLLEPGLYRMVFRSRKPEAERFRRWVFHEVLPSIRRTGGYVSPALVEALQQKLDRYEERVDALIGLVRQERSARVGASGWELRRHQLDADKRRALERAAGRGEVQVDIPFAPPPRRERQPLPRPTSEQVVALLAAWAEQFGHDEGACAATVVDALHTACNVRELAHALVPFGPTANVVGRVLARFADMPVGGFVLVRAGLSARTRATRWRVETAAKRTVHATTNGAERSGGAS
jgi:prophage antirepressor-like protein